MDVRTAGRQMIDTWLKFARFPVDTATRLLPNGDRGPRNPAMLFIDRADATVRDAVGAVLRDGELREDARRRRAAADERARALELTVKAEEKKREADQRLAATQESVEQERAKAEESAQEAKQRVDKERAERERRAEQTAIRQARAVEQARQAKMDAAERKAKLGRLEVLEDRTRALGEEADALTANDEAIRLRKEASKAKAARKGTG